MFRFALALCLLLTPVVGSGQVVQRYSLTIDGIDEQPTVLDIFGLGLDIDVVESDEGRAVIRKSPGPGKAEPLSFFLPEIDDEVVVMFEWFRRISSGELEAHDADLVGYDANGNAVARWHFSNAWPSKITGPQLPAPETGGRVGHFITLQVDGLTRESTEQAAPWPDVVSTTIDRSAGTFTMGWRSVAGATYNVYGWDPVKKEQVLAEQGITATGDLTFISRLLEEEGIFWTVLTSSPPAP